MWKMLRHPNILPLIGVTMSETHFAMVSDWMIDGNITNFVKTHPDVNRLALVGSLSGPYCLCFKLINDWVTCLAGRRY
jgi:hypothetical protein